jgi:hypothetical protein
MNLLPNSLSLDRLSFSASPQKFIPVGARGLGIETEVVMASFERLVTERRIFIRFTEYSDATVDTVHWRHHRHARGLQNSVASAPPTINEKQPIAFSALSIFQTIHFYVQKMMFENKEKENEKGELKRPHRIFQVHFSDTDYFEIRLRQVF